MPKIKRTIKLIDRRFQGVLIAQLIAINGLVLAVCGYVLYLFMNSEIQANLAMAQVNYRTMSQMLMPIFITLSLINIILVALVAAAAVLVASHRIAGPLFRFQTALKQMVSGNLKPLTRLRKADQLQELSKTLQELSQAYSQDIMVISQAAREMRDQLADAFPAALARIEETVKRYRLD